MFLYEEKYEMFLFDALVMIKKISSYAWANVRT